MEKKTSSKDKFLIFQSNNNPTVDLAGTAVIKAIQKAYPDRKIIVTTNFVEVWLHNPNVFRVYRLGQTPYFFNDFIENRDTIVFAHDPLKDSAYINKEKHLIEAWCEMCKAKYEGELPSLHFTQRESEVAWRLTKADQPLFFIQPFEMFGAVSSNGWSWPKDLPLPVVNQISNEMSTKGYLPIVIKNPNQPVVSSAHFLQLNLRLTMAALQFSEKRLFIDSFLQAAAAALNKPSVVTWFSTHPKNNGYQIHHNIIADLETNYKEEVDNYCPIVDFDQVALNKPLDTTFSYSAEKIISEILK